MCIVTLAFLFIACQKGGNPDEILEVKTMQVEPDVYFHQAITDFANKDYKKSAESIRRAIQVMDSIALVAHPEQREKIKKSTEELLDLQSNVAFDKVDGIEDLNYCFAHAGQALTGYHMHVYKTEYYNLESRKAGKELSKAISLIENSVTFNDHEFDAEELAVLTALKNNADLLKEGKETSKTNIEALLTKLNEHMNKWGDEIEVNYRKFHKSRKVVIHKKI